MVTSMTGFGRGEAVSADMTISVELRSVNNRFLDVTARLPRTLSMRENDLKEIIRKKISRGKISVTVTLDRTVNGNFPLRVNLPAARAYHRLLNQLRKAVRVKEPVKLEHLLQFSEVIEPLDATGGDEQEWEVLQQALSQGIEGLQEMRRNEGKELEADFRGRIAELGRTIDIIEGLSREQVPQERLRLRERIGRLLEGEPVDEGRLEMELALLADKLDVTEECVRFRSHNKFFLEAMGGSEPAGRKLNFLLQEMNREANTIGSKSSATEIAHLVVSVKEELEKVREQLQNIE